MINDVYDGIWVSLDSNINLQVEYGQVRNQQATGGKQICLLFYVRMAKPAAKC